MSRELLSAAVDNAATAAEWEQLLAAVDRDPELMSEWSRIWQCRDAQAGVALAASVQHFCTGVMAALVEPEVMGGNVVALASRGSTARVSDAPSTRPRASAWRSLVPLSAAAGVVAAVLFFGRPLLLTDAPATVAVLSSPIASQDANATETASAPAAVAVNDDSNLQSLDPASMQVLNGYLMEHSNALAERSMGGAISNARFAARTADYRPDGQ